MISCHFALAFNPPFMSDCLPVTFFYSTDAQTTCAGFINTVSGSKTPGWSVSLTGFKYSDVEREVPTDT
jgi:hypothetical protein